MAETYQRDILIKLGTYMHDTSHGEAMVEIDLILNSQKKHAPPFPRANTGGRLNKKDGLTRDDDSHVKDKTS